MSEDPTIEEFESYRELSARSAAAHARYAEMLEQERERELRSGHFQYSSASDEARSVVKEFLLYFFGAAVLLVPASLGAVALVLVLLGVDLDSIPNAVTVILWLGASIGFAYWGVGHGDAAKARQDRNSQAQRRD
jgi:VIT1/CCC1 family predicted Fe2+/Mn2+ transporter